MTTNLDFEKSLWEKGVELIAGVDEVGRGALAGPMVVGAVILKKEDLTRVHNILINNDIEKLKNKEAGESIYRNIKDSKLLSPKRREALSDFILEKCVCHATFQIPAKEIDTKGISACTQKAFYEVIKALKVAPEHILTDAFKINNFPQAIQTNIIAGDRVSITISAASIVAKVFRDKLMSDLGKREEYLAYEFGKHKGYGTKLHLERIAKHGTCDLHRKTFIH